MSETRKPLAETDDKFAELRRPLDEVEVRFIKELAALRGQIAELDRRGRHHALMITRGASGR